MNSDRESSIVGAVISHYRVIERVGAGGMGVVYKAEDSRLQRYVALKFLVEDTTHPEALNRFRREARAASALNHPGICTVHDIGEHDGHPFIVMEYLEGENVKERISGQGPAAAAAFSRRSISTPPSISRPRLPTHSMRPTPRESFIAISNPRMFSSRNAAGRKFWISASPSPGCGGMKPAPPS
jgi:hypothetical protein